MIFMMIIHLHSTLNLLQRHLASDTDGKLLMVHRWENDGRNPCEVNWLDPEPDIGSSGHEEYIEELQEIEHEVAMSTYRGFHQPPTEEEYRERWFAQQERHSAPDNYDY